MPQRLGQPVKCAGSPTAKHVIAGGLAKLNILWGGKPSAELTAYCSSKSIKLNRMY